MIVLTACFEDRDKSFIELNRKYEHDKIIGILINEFSCPYGVLKNENRTLEMMVITEKKILNLKLKVFLLLFATNTPKANEGKYITSLISNVFVRYAYIINIVIKIM